MGGIVNARSYELNHHFQCVLRRNDSVQNHDQSVEVSDACGEVCPPLPSANSPEDDMARGVIPNDMWIHDDPCGWAYFDLHLQFWPALSAAVPGAEQRQQHSRSFDVKT